MLNSVALQQFFLFRDGAPTLLVTGRHEPWLVVLSLLVATLTSALALQVARTAQRSEGWPRQAALVSGAAALGGGVWAMHFIGMLAFQLCTTVRFNAGVTLASLLPAFAASWVALTMLSRGRLSAGQLLQSGVLVGGGIGAMHYTGMAAMDMSAQLRYDPWWFAASILVAVLLAVLALWIGFGLEGRLRRPIVVPLGGLVMGCAIAGMHYTAMGAARFVVLAEEPCDAYVSNDFLALAITVVALATSALTAGANGLLGYRRLTEQLRAEKSRMQAVLDTAVDGVVTIDGAGLIRSFNRGAERLFGWTEAELLGRNVKMLMPEPDQSRHDGYLRRHLDTGHTSIIGVGRDVVAQHRDGQRFPIRLAIGRVDRPGEPLFVAFVSDIRERQQMEQALRDSEQQYRSLIANSPGVNFRGRVDAEWSMVVISDAVQSLTGWPASDFLAGRVHLATLIDAQDRAGVEAAVAAALEADDCYVVEYRLYTRDGDQRWVSETGRGARDAQGRMQWIDGVILDISEAKRLQRQLQEAKTNAESAAAAKSAFLANMSHEIRTPMNAILGFTELLLDTSLSESQRKHLSTVRGSARALLGLLNDILDTAKLDKGAVELEQADFSLQAVCGQALASLRLLAQRKGLSLQLDYPDEEARFFRGDALRVQQVLLNLVGNAIKFTERGSVILRMRTEQDQVHLSVVDTGIGIAPDRLAHIFDAFAQADASTTRRFGGTGLGTTISRQLVERMGGRITVESEPGQGSCFHVWLPLMLADEPVAAEGGGEEETVLPPLRLLVADDVPQNVELLELVLGRDGHSVQVAGDGLQALKSFGEGQFDAVLMDVHMPGLDGLGATRRIRKLELTQGRPRTPIIALTASVLEEDRQAALTAGMDGFAAKPLEPVRLRAELARVLGLSPVRTAAAMGAAPVLGAADPPLDWVRGLALWGSVDAWHRALRRFVREQRDGAARLQALLQAHQWQEARAQVHRWRGLAGSLALPRMLAATLPLEECLHAGRHADCAGLADALVGAFAEAVQEIAELDVAPSQPAALADGPDQPPPVELLERLEQALQRGEFDDAALLGLQQSMGAARCLPVAQALEQFDFDAALRALRDLQKA